MVTAKDVIKKLDLSPHPEGGYYRRTYQNEGGAEARGRATSIYYFLEGTDFAKWHSTDGDEIWYWHAGAALTLEIDLHHKGVQSYELGPDIFHGQAPQILVPADNWQRARSNGDWTLVSCMVSPGFLFDSYELIEDENWHPDLNK
ncbi:cupin domain-containing protein [Kordiimonas sp. SCSIO 12603]|uniref:cupin domain-containing protein n=1 Tax=Kordiimonas sp. SCSIO 12603 TaxID=2829596 RepID=UPI0021071753|nr:cupin domain-containing protein [Kordiimonas sp. SCSIO 12603]UTW60360.1 cupin domain-containing protein [Kordiimonas sp. SCSIO 12603]